MISLLSAGFAHLAQCAGNSDPVIDLLLEKGMITDAEAAKVQTILEQRRTNAAPAFLGGGSTQWKINPAIKSVELFGDVRLRYEDRSVTDPDGGRIALNRLRYALRFGVRGELFDNFNYGFRLDTAANPRSPWVTFGSSSSGAPYQGPFGKSTAGINVGQLYLGYQPFEGLSITAGKMPQPLVTTPMVWDNDLNPEGLAEHFTRRIGDLDIFGNFGQFIYQDTNPTKASQGFFGAGNLFPSQTGNGTSPLAFMLAWQVGANYHFDTNVSFQIAPALYNYVGHGVDTSQSASFTGPGFSGTFVGQGATNGVNGVPNSGFSGFPNGFEDGFNANQTGINDLLVLEIPWQFDFKIADFNMRLFGDFAKNLEGADRANAAMMAANNPPGPPQIGGVAPITSAQTHDDIAYQIGFAIGNKDSLGMVYGSKSMRHAWEFRTYWQHIEQYALDPNLLDSDFFEGRGNLEGVYSAFAYGLTDNFITTLRYGNARRINNQIGTGGSNQDIPQMNPIQHYQIIQLDLSMRF